jgi:catechol 2,3-dioxygenase-like lactoylglutathione lyase family enzyme
MTMKIIPLLRCNDLKEAIAFYTNVLDFTLKYSDEANNEWAIELINNDAEILLASRDGTPRIAIIVRVDDLDAVFKKYVDRGLIVPNNPDSPVHNGPIDQTWGMREFYVNDPDGNTLRFSTPIG